MLLNILYIIKTKQLRGEQQYIEIFQKITHWSAFMEIIRSTFQCIFIP